MNERKSLGYVWRSLGPKPLGLEEMSGKNNIA